MHYIGKERALKRISARRAQFQIDEQTHNKVDIEHLLKRIDLSTDEFLIYYFTTTDNESILLSSRRFMLFDTSQDVRFIEIEEIKEVKFNPVFKSDLDASFLLILDLYTQPSLTISMPNGPEGISLVNAISAIRRVMYE
ncbi:hypothetical protein [Xanthocytophaga agilis]|uniref:PH domain-containing protein n=1 Tax=Xanthocytophaga agilis TaxID=3048010 RepID=A0AAE3UCK0_9BACT|nr:hypothetical protein [Xanthocytophaga agilis]MDJ1499456.1 hypothetical protein [Xanthocytophaga agilis]